MYYGFLIIIVKNDFFSKMNIFGFIGTFMKKKLGPGQIKYVFSNVKGFMLLKIFA